MCDTTPGAPAPAVQQHLISIGRTLSRAHALLVLLGRTDLAPDDEESGPGIMDEAVIQNALFVIADLVQQAWNQVDLAALALATMGKESGHEEEPHHAIST